MQTLLSQLKAARRCSVPLVAISTPDPWATVEAVCEALRGEMLAVDVPEDENDNPLVPRVEWDYVRGMTGRNAAGQAWVKGLGEFDETQNNPFRALVVAQKLPPGSVLFFHLAHRFIQEPALIQAIANLRDPFKGNQRTLCLLGQGMQLPTELQGDVVALDEPAHDRHVQDPGSTGGAPTDPPGLVGRIEEPEGEPDERRTAVGRLRHGHLVDLLERCVLAHAWASLATHGGPDGPAHLVDIGPGGADLGPRADGAPPAMMSAHFWRLMRGLPASSAGSRSRCAAPPRSPPGSS